MTSSSTKLKYDVGRLHAYEYCPARFKLETRSNIETPNTRFDVLRKIFQSFFLREHKYRDNYSSISRLMKKYKGLLFSGKKFLKQELLYAFMIKSIEKLKIDISPQANYFITGKLDVEYKNLILSQDVDLMYVTPESKNKRARTGFLILVEDTYWDNISLSNRLDNYVITKHIWPNLPKEFGGGGFEITYYNPHSGIKYTIPGEKLVKLLNKNDEVRLDWTVQQIQNRYFSRRPCGVTCNKCPSIKACQPATKDVKTTKLKEEINL
jgi:hypothetical protein